MKLKLKFIMLYMILMLAALACNLPFIGQQNNVKVNDIPELPDGLTENYVPEMATFTNPFSYSAEQQATLETHGAPTRFTIIFSNPGRHETWVYDTSGYTVVFRDGEKIAEKTEISQYQEEMYATALKPDQFYNGMGVDEVVLSTGRSNLTFVTLEGLDKDTRLMYLEGLSVGVVDSKINFVETIPSTTEIPLSQADFAPANQQPPAPEVLSLTPEEEANQGVHSYIVLYEVNGETMQEMFGEIEFGFQGKVMLMTFEGDQIEFDQIDTNQYYADVDGGISITFTADGLVFFIENENTGLILNRTDEQTTPEQVVPTEDPAGAALTPEETTNQGTHTYEVTVFQNDEIIEEHTTTFTFNFVEGGCQLGENGSVAFFIQIAPNQYEEDAEDPILMTFNSDGFTWTFYDSQYLSRFVLQH